MKKKKKSYHIKSITLSCLAISLLTRFAKSTAVSPSSRVMGGKYQILHTIDQLVIISKTCCTADCLLLFQNALPNVASYWDFSHGCNHEDRLFRNNHLFDNFLFTVPLVQSDKRLLRLRKLLFWIALQPYYLCMFLPGIKESDCCRDVGHALVI